LESQVKLLRVIQEGEYTRLGGAKTLFTDVVVYATSNRDLEDMIAAGTFRSDLFYRLNVVQLHVPPLRDRKSDIPLLVQYFIDKHCADMKIPVKSITPQAVEHLQNRIAWSGNIRELENTVLRAIVFTPDETITIESFKEMRPEKPGVFGLKPFIMQQIGSIELNKNSLDLLRKELQKEVSRMLDLEFLERSSKLFNGNISRIAENTGIYRTHLYKMMQRVGFDVGKLKE
jgi:DNA-binding NtrC family response regulator